MDLHFWMETQDADTDTPAWIALHGLSRQEQCPLILPKQLQKNRAWLNENPFFYELWRSYVDRYRQHLPPILGPSPFASLLREIPFSVVDAAPESAAAANPTASPSSSTSPSLNGFHSRSDYHEMTHSLSLPNDVVAAAAAVPSGHHDMHPHGSVTGGPRADWLCVTPQSTPENIIFNCTDPSRMLKTGLQFFLSLNGQVVTCVINDAAVFQANLDVARLDLIRWKTYAPLKETEEGRRFAHLLPLMTRVHHHEHVLAANAADVSPHGLQLKQVVSTELFMGAAQVVEEQVALWGPRAFTFRLTHHSHGTTSPAVVTPGIMMPPRKRFLFVLRKNSNAIPSSPSPPLSSHSTLSSASSVELDRSETQGTEMMVV